MARRKNRSRRKNGNGNGTASKTPNVTLTRKFRQTSQYELNNTTGSGINQYAYYSKYLKPTPDQCLGFKDCQSTFEFWRLKKLRVKAILGYNDYNQSYNTINLAALASLQLWTASDFSANENVSGVSIMSYNNAKCNTVSFNNFVKIVDTQCRINDMTSLPKTLLPASTWLDTSTDLSQMQYSGFQFFAMMPGMQSNNYLPRVQLVFEYECEFKQPAYQNRPTSFESDFVGATLLCIPDASLPDTREYRVVSYTINDSGNNVRLERTDGQAGSLDYTQAEFFTVFVTGKSQKYFGNRPAVYTGPTPRRPEDFSPVPPP